MDENLPPTSSSSHSVPGKEAQNLLNLGLKLGASREEYILSSPPISLKIIGDYELLHELGKGGMGTVYKARQKSLNRIVALKMIRGAHLATEGQRLRFRREAEMIAALDHPNIIHIHEFGEFEGMPYFSMEYIEGLTLQEWLSDMRLFWKVSVSLIETIARTMDYAHKKGVLHRDLKPSNIIVDDQGIPRITDFGLACQIDVESGLTISGTMLGSPFYMAPEQTRGATEKLGAATDIYSMGAMLYTMLTGKPPYEGRNFHEVMDRMLREEPVDPKKLNKEIPKGLAGICLKCLEKEPRHRYPNALALAEDLRRVREGLVVQVRRAGFRRIKTGWQTALFGFISLLGVLATAFLVNRQMYPSAVTPADKGAPSQKLLTGSSESKSSDTMPRDITAEEYKQIDGPALEAAEAYHIYLMVLGAREIFHKKLTRWTGKEEDPLQPIDFSPLHMNDKAKAYVVAYDKVYAPMYASNGHQIKTEETIKEIDRTYSLISKAPSEPTVFTMAFEFMISQIPEAKTAYTQYVISGTNLLKKPDDENRRTIHLNNIKTLFGILISYAGEPMETCLVYSRDMFIADIEKRPEPAAPLKWPGFTPLKKEYPGTPYTQASTKGYGVYIPRTTYYTWQIQVLLPYVEGKNIVIQPTPIHFPYPQSFTTTKVFDATMEDFLRKIVSEDYTVKRDEEKLTIIPVSGPNFYSPEFNPFMRGTLRSAHEEMDVLKAQSQDNEPIPVEKAKWLIGETATVIGLVDTINSGGGGHNMYVDFGGDFWNASFRIQIPINEVDKFGDLERLQGKKLSVSGEIKLIYGAPGMTISDPNSLKILEN